MPCCYYGVCPANIQLAPLIAQFLEILQIQKELSLWSPLSYALWKEKPHGNTHTFHLSIMPFIQDLALSWLRVRLNFFKASHWWKQRREVTHYAASAMCTWCLSRDSSVLHLVPQISNEKALTVQGDENSRWQLKKYHVYKEEFKDILCDYFKL